MSSNCETSFPTVCIRTASRRFVYLGVTKLYEIWSTPLLQSRAGGLKSLVSRAADVRLTSATNFKKMWKKILNQFIYSIVLTSVGLRNILGLSVEHSIIRLELVSSSSCWCCFASACLAEHARFPLRAINGFVPWGTREIPMVRWPRPNGSEQRERWGRFGQISSREGVHPPRRGALRYMFPLLLVGVVVWCKAVGKADLLSVHFDSKQSPGFLRLYHLLFISFLVSLPFRLCRGRCDGSS